MRPSCVPNAAVPIFVIAVVASGCGPSAPISGEPIQSPAVSADTEPTQARAGELDPAAHFARWADDELYLSTPILTAPVAASHSRIYEAANTLTSLTLLDDVARTDAADQHEGIDAEVGRFVTPERDSIVEVYRNGAALDVRFFKETAASATLTELMPRQLGCGDFFDLAAGELDGLVPRGQDRRDELVVAYAKGEALSAPVQVAVMTFDQPEVVPPELPQPPLPLRTTTALASGTLDPLLRNGEPYPPRNAIALTTGDFDGDGLKEIAVAYLERRGVVRVDVLRYTAAYDAEVHGVVTSLAVIASADVHGAESLTAFASLSATAGDLDRDGRDELALGTAHYDPGAGQRIVHARLFRLAGTPLALTVFRELELFRGAIGGVRAEVRVAAGNFRLSPAEGWVPQQRQLAVAYRALAGNIAIRTIEVKPDLTIVVSNAATRPDPNGTIGLAVGGFRGTLRPPSDGKSAVPSHSLAVVAWGWYAGVGGWTVALYEPGAGTIAPRMTYASAPVGAKTPVDESRLGLAAADVDGDTVYLGAPAHFVVHGLPRTDFILQEPPKHAFWDKWSAQKSVVNVSRFDNFNVSLLSSEGTQLTSSSTDTTASAWGGSVKANASATIGMGFDYAVVKGEQSVTVTAEAALGYDFDRTKEATKSSFVARTLTFGRTANRDDILVMRAQSMDIWRYRVYGVKGTTADLPFLDIVVPGPYEKYYGVGSRNLPWHWYQPMHENGNILSYPRRDDPQFATPDVGAVVKNDAPLPVTGFLYGTPQDVNVEYFEPSPAFTALDFTQGTGQAVKLGYSQSVDKNASLGVSASIEAKGFGAEASATASVALEAHANKSWSQARTSESSTTTTTGISINRFWAGAAAGGPTDAKGSSDQAYGYYPLVYMTSDGTIKAMFAVDPLKSTQGERFWRTRYALPDLALNLPLRFVDTAPDVFEPNLSIQRKLMRGFFVRTEAVDAVTGDLGYLSPEMVSKNAKVRLQARVYNYGVGAAVPMDVADACFYSVKLDALENEGPLEPIGCASIPEIQPQRHAVVEVPWTVPAPTEPFSPYRIYVRLDTGGALTETYDTETTPSWKEASDYCDPADRKYCIDPGQNNEGWAKITIVDPPVASGGAQKPAHVGIPRDGIAGVDRDGELVTRHVQAWVGRPFRFRVTVASDARRMSTSYVMVFDGDPDRGGEPIAGEMVFTGAPDVPVWFEWIPRQPGVHKLFARVTQGVDDGAPGDNIGMIQVVAIPFKPGATK